MNATDPVETTAGADTLAWEIFRADNVNIPEDELRAGFPAEAEYALNIASRLRAAGYAKPTPEPEYEWGEGPDQFDGHIVPRMSEETARHSMKHRHDYGIESHVFRRQVGPWEVVK